MASGKASSSRKRVLEWLAGRGTSEVTESVWTDLITAFPEVKQQTLRHAVRDSGLALAPLVEGVRQSSLSELYRSLTALQHEYEAAAGARKRQIRALVIEAKTHAKFSASKNPEKAEMVQWMLVWLEDPSLFETWGRLRLASLRGGDTGEMANPHTGETDAD